ncbi:MAG: hypothetical protein N3G76_01815 [Candidatus Micrarchaeota archaeon]|nr:hypothetical protein [Candidatus Micrarchaeota archaeon]
MIEVLPTILLSAGQLQGPAIQFTEFFYNLFPVAVLVVSIHFLLVALMFMAGKIFSNESLIGFSKHEFGQAIFSLIIIGSLLTVIPLVNMIFCTALGESGYIIQGSCSPQNLGITAHLKVARDHLAEAYNNVRVLAKGTLRAFDWAATCAGMSTSAGLFQISSMKYNSFHAYVYGESFTMLYRVLLFLKFQELFMVLNAIYFFPFLFNVGLVLRILPFTRKIGGLLMGITLGLFFVLPYMYILSQTVVESAEHFSTKFVLDTSKYMFFCITFSDLVDPGGQRISFDEIIEKKREEAAKAGGDSSINVAGQAAAEILSKINSNPQQGFGYSIGKGGNLPNPRDTGAFGTSKDYYDPDNPTSHKYSLVEAVARAVLMATFTSIFAIAGTLSAIREISVMFGGDVEIAGLTKLI